MTVAAITRKAGPFTNSTTTPSIGPFPFKFKIFATSDIQVIMSTTNDPNKGTKTLTYGTDYTLSVDFSAQDANAGGSVTLTGDLTTGTGTMLQPGFYLTILSSVPYSQLTRLTNYDRFMPDILNDVHDRVVALTQQLKEQNDRTLSVPATSSTKPSEYLEDVFKARDEAQASASSASASAGASAVSEANAKESEKNAAASESAAAQSEANAKASENAAKSSETKAKASEDAAKASETKAGEYADSAEASATTASAMATKAAASEANAKASENAAKSSETNAKASETSASASKTAAANSAQEAKDAAAQAVAGQVNANWTETDTTSKAYIKNKPALKTVATSGSYTDLDNKPSPIQYVAQTLTTAQQTQARTNIDAVSESELRTALEELIVEYGGTVPTD